MKVTLVYRHALTGRTRTLKNVKYMGGVHARAIEEAMPGTHVRYPIYPDDVPQVRYEQKKVTQGINYGIPIGFRIVRTKGERPAFRKVDTRTARGKKDVAVGTAHKKTLDELNKKYFGGPAHLYVKVPKKRTTRTANVVDYPIDPSNFYIGQRLPDRWPVVKEELAYSLPMRYLSHFKSQAEKEEEFNGRPAYVFWLSWFPQDIRAVDDLRKQSYTEWDIPSLLATSGVNCKELCDSIASLTISNPILMVVYKDELKEWLNIETLNPSFYASGLDVPAGRDNPMINSPLIEYHIQPSHTWAGLFTQEAPGPENACYFTFIWHYGIEEDTRFQARNKELYATIKVDPYRWMYGICFPDKPYTGEFDMVTSRQMIPLLDVLGKELKVFDSCSQLWSHYRPPIIRDSNRKVLCMIVHNNHVYPCNRSQKLAHYTESSRYNVETGTVLERWLNKDTAPQPPRPTVSFPMARDKKSDTTVEDGEIVRYDAPPMFLDSDCAEDAAAHIITHPHPSEEYTHYQFYVSTPMKDLYNSIYQQSAYECGPVASNSKIWAGLNCTNLVRCGVPIQVRFRAVPTLLSPILDTFANQKEAEQMLQLYFAVDKQVKSEVLSPTILSQYSSHTLAFYKHYKRGGRTGHFLSEDDFDRMDKTRQLLGMDFAKFYTYVLCSFKKLQVLSMFDDPLPYDGHGLEDYNTYAVQFYGETYTYQEYSLCMGKNLRRRPSDSYHVMAYIRPSRLADNHIPDVIQDLWNSSIPGELKKIIGNTMSGVLGMDHGSSYYSRTFYNKDDAAHHMGFMDTNKTEYIKHTFSVDSTNLRTDWATNKEIYTLVQNDRSDYHSGFLPLYHMLIDTADTIMYDLQKQIEAVGLRLVGRHCDNLYMDVDYDNRDDVITTCRQLRDRLCPTIDDDDEYLGEKFISNTYESFGRLKPEPKKLSNKYNPMRIVANEPFKHPKTRTSRQVIGCDEWNEQEMFSIIKRNKFLFISAIDAGSGKTHICINYVKQYEDLKVLVLSYQNDKVADLRKNFDDYEFKQNVTVSTIDAFFSWKKEALAQAYTRLKEYHLVIVDEFDMTPIPTLTKLMRAVDQGLIKQMIITGDCHQLEAINQYTNNIDSQEQYYDRIKTKWFPVELRLTQIKRARCAAHQVVYDLPTIRDCVDCQTARNTAAKIYKTIREAPDDETAQNFVLDTFKHVKSTKEVENENLITFHVDTRNTLNKICHQRILREKSLQADTKHYEGQKLVFNKRHDFKEGTIHRNYVVIFRRYLNDAAQATPDGLASVARNKEFSVIYEPFEDKEYTMKTSTLNGHTRLSHAVTCHSKQGASIRGNTYIFDIRADHATRNWLYVAVSRNTDIWKNYIYTGPSFHTTFFQITATIKTMIESHRRADVKAGRRFTADNYIHFGDVIAMLDRTRYCAWCQEDVTPNGFSIDRIDSELAHIKGNCQLLCSSKCNSAKRKNYEAVV